jgi:hypothetical protein
MRRRDHVSSIWNIEDVLFYIELIFFFLLAACNSIVPTVELFQGISRQVG